MLSAKLKMIFVDKKYRQLSGYIAKKHWRPAREGSGGGLRNDPQGPVLRVLAAML
jgi:hypothetical protein